MVAAATSGRAPCGGIISRVCVWVVLLWQLSLAVAEAPLLTSSTGVSTHVAGVASEVDQAQDAGFYGISRRDQMAGSALEDNVGGGDQKGAEADITKEQIELAEVIGDYALDKKAKLVREMSRASKNGAFGMIWVLVCVAFFEVLYQSYVKPAATELQKGYMKMHPGREPKPLSLVEILLASPVAAAAATAIAVAMVMAISNVFMNMYASRVKLMDLNTLLEEEKLEEQERAAKKKAAESGST